MELDDLLIELEKLGCENELIEIDKRKKFLNSTRDTGQFIKLMIKAINAKKILEQY